MNKKFWRHRNVFITGSTGLLGSWISRYLVEAAANVTVLIRDHIPNSNLFLSNIHSQVNIIRGKVEDYLTIERILGEYEIDSVFHLAAQTIAPIANRNPLSTFETNIKGSWVMLEACRRSSLVTRVIIASSDKAYGDSAKLPYTEDIPLCGKHPYDVSKSCADLLAQSYNASYNLPVCITRCGNLFGGGDLNFNRLIPGVIRSVLFNEPFVLRSDGKHIRDFIYVEDAAYAVMKVAECMDKTKIIGQAFNFSNETPMTVLEMVKRVMKRMSSDLEIVIKNESTNEIRKQYLSSEKARKLLKWKPIFSLDEAIDKTFNWYQELYYKDDLINFNGEADKNRERLYDKK